MKDHEDTAMNTELPLIAGAISTTIFALSALPMLLKAFRTKDLRSYSLGHILLDNVGNVIHSVYVFSLPARSGCCTASTWSPQV